MVDIMPEVMQCVKDAGYLPMWIKFHEMVCDHTFPMEDICFGLFIGVVRFVGNTNTLQSQMRYTEDVKTFWATGYKLFHGRFLRFMSGPKSFGQVAKGDCQPSFYKPRKWKLA